MKALTTRFLLAACIALLVLLAAACEHTDPLAEAGNTIELDANPETINLGNKPDGKSVITATVKNDNGAPKSGVNVIFKTDSGTLASGGQAVETNGAGEAKDTLTTGVDATVTAKSGPVSESVDVFIGGSNHAPTAAFTLNPATQLPDMLVTFDGSGSTDPEGKSTIAQWTWTLTSDNIDTSPSGPPECTVTSPAIITCDFTGVSNFTMAFTNAQNVAVSLQVTDDLGLSSSNAATANLAITGNLAPVADAGSNIITTVGTIVDFDDGLSNDPNPGGAIIRWDWTFGDGTSSLNNSAGTASHAYTAASGVGGYILTLTVWDNGDGTVGCNAANTPPCPNSKTGQDSKFVTVNPVP